MGENTSPAPAPAPESPKGRQAAKARQAAEQKAQAEILAKPRSVEVRTRRTISVGPGPVPPETLLGTVQLVPGVNLAFLARAVESGAAGEVPAAE